MKLFPCVLASCLMVAVVDAADEPKDKTDKSKLVGVWELKEGNPDIVVLEGEKTSLKFTKDGTVKVITHNVDLLAPIAKASLIQSGTYKVDGNKLTIDIDDVRLMGINQINLNIDPKVEAERSIKITITKLTDKDLHMKNKEGELGEFTRKK